MKADKLLDIMWPRRCELCSGAVDRPGRYFCSQCLMDVPFVSQKGGCQVCGRDVDGFSGSFLCERCREIPPAFDFATGAIDFTGKLRELVLAYKSRRALWLCEDFADWMHAACSARYDLNLVDVVLPMPVTLGNRISRGYNQAFFLAKALSRRIDRVCCENAVVRCGNPRKQAELNEQERRENVRGTFYVNKPGLVKGRTVLLVDDILTTGSTLSECARMLKEAGAWRVWCVTLARAVWDS